MYDYIEGFDKNIKRFRKDDNKVESKVILRNYTEVNSITLSSCNKFIIFGSEDSNLRF